MILICHTVFMMVILSLNITRVTTKSLVFRLIFSQLQVYSVHFPALFNNLADYNRFNYISELS